MTIKHARKILGKIAEGVSDEQLQEELKMAELFKTIFFSQYRHAGSKNIYNKQEHGEA